MRHSPATLALIACLAFAPATNVAAQPMVAPMAVPFLVGEELVYHASYIGLSAGTGRLRLVAVDTIRGRAAYHVIFTLDGGIPLFRIHDRYETWIDVETLASLRYVQQISEGHYRRTTTFEIYPESSTYTKNGGPMLESVASPLDDFAFFYAVRAQGLGVGQTRSDARYFIPDKNPVVLTWVGRDTISVAAGTFATTIVHPMIKTTAFFSENTDARIWFSDDAHRYPVKLHTKFAKFSLTLSLESVTAGQPRVGQ